MAELSVDTLILDPSEYSALRGSRRAEAIEVRRGRRVPVGDLVLIEFETATTLLYQAQEMVYVERVTDPTSAAQEIAVYQRLLPTPLSLTATMLIEITDQGAVRFALGRLNGLHESVRLEVGGTPYPGRDIPPPDEGPSTKTVSVHFLGFDLTAEAVDQLASGAPVSLVIDHPAYQARAELSPELVDSLVTDLRGAA
jgi:glycerol-3-phosphate dehydrogenase subunit C